LTKDNNEELERSEYPILDVDVWEADRALRESSREFPTYFETVVDTVDGPKLTSFDLRDLSKEELEELVPVNKYAYLELFHRQLNNLE